MREYGFKSKRRKGIGLAALSILSGGLITLLLSITITFWAERVATASPSQEALNAEAAGLLIKQHELQVTSPGVEGTGFTIAYRVLSLELFITGLLVILGGVVLVHLKFRRARTKQRREQSQELDRFVGDKKEAQHRADERGHQQKLQQQVWPLPQTATVVKKIASPIGQHLADLLCPNCGQLVPAGATFCSHCGVSLVASKLGQQQSFPSPTYSVSEEPMVQIAPGTSENEHTDIGRSMSSCEVQPSTGLAVDALSNPGIKRQHKPNEDSLFVTQGMRPHSSQQQLFGLFIVADGVGGHVYGQEASRLGIQTMIDWVLPVVSGSGELNEADFRQLLIDGVQAANQAIHQRNNEQRTDMGTTITAALVVGCTACVVNVGDSRTYLYRASEGLRKITNDHSLVAYLVDAGIIKADDIYTHPQRNQLYRSLGAKPLIQIDVFMEQLRPGDILLLCSDGLWEMVRDPSILQILRHGADPLQMSQALIEAALEGGGADNVSVIVVQVTGATRYTDAMGIQLIAKPETVEIPDLSHSESKQSPQG